MWACPFTLQHERIGPTARIFSDLLGSLFGFISVQLWSRGFVTVTEKKFVHNFLTIMISAGLSMLKNLLLFNLITV